MPEPVTGSSRWTFLTHHARVLLEIARNPQVRLRDIAAIIGITERAVQTIVNDLTEAGYLTRERIGRRNRYSVHPDQHLRYPTEADMPISRLLDMFASRDFPPHPAAETADPTSLGSSAGR